MTRTPTGPISSCCDAPLRLSKAENFLVCTECTNAFVDDDHISQETMDEIKRRVDEDCGCRTCLKHMEEEIGEPEDVPVTDELQEKMDRVADILLPDHE